MYRSLIPNIVCNLIVSAKLPVNGINDPLTQLKRFSLVYSGITNHGERGEHGEVQFCSAP
jgi:hypothetical protein